MSSTVSFSVRVTPKNKTYLNEVLGTIPDIYPDVDSKRKALLKVFDVFVESYQTTEDEDDILKQTEIKRVLDLIDCEYLIYDNAVGGFVCNEFYYKKKKTDTIDSRPESAIEKCQLCKKGKSDERERKIEVYLQKDSTKKILELRKMLLTYITEGFEVDVYLCRGLWASSQQLIGSRDGNYFKCPMRDEDDIVNIHKICMETINEKTAKPPCRFLINLMPKVKIEKVEETIKEFISELPKLQAPFEPEETEEPKHVEAKVIEGEAEEIKEPEETDKKEK